MLTLNPKKRITAQEALSDPWIANNNLSTALNKNIIDNLTSFQVGVLDGRVKADSDTPS